MPTTDEVHAAIQKKARLDAIDSEIISIAERKAALELERRLVHAGVNPIGYKKALDWVLNHNWPEEDLELIEVLAAYEGALPGA